MWSMSRNDNHHCNHIIVVYKNKNLKCNNKNSILNNKK